MPNFERIWKYVQKMNELNLHYDYELYLTGWIPSIRILTVLFRIFKPEHSHLPFFMVQAGSKH